MAKKALRATWRNLWPLPATTVLASCVGRDRPPNIITIGACGIASGGPLLISLAIGSGQYSLELIKETGDFAVNIPSSDQTWITDWCGCVSGRNVDKFAEAKLTPGKSMRISAPYIAECPVNYECVVWGIVGCGSHDLVLGEIQQVHIDEEMVTESGTLDTSAFNPLVSFQLEYWNLGKKLEDWRFTRKEKA
ncbi:MAG: flavin reductase family protein [Planctomycetes bacterium]|nr:flavin reductase family protein [Planctomycetota bacterium]